jgi:predicted dehydrogenase
VLEAPWRWDWGGRVLLGGEEVEVPPANPYERELSNLAGAIAGTGEPLLGRDDAVAQARIIEALYHSAETGEAVGL